jgi:hypothetical protein
MIIYLDHFIYNTQMLATKEICLIYSLEKYIINLIIHSHK